MKFQEAEDFPRGNSNVYAVDCTPAKVPGRMFFVAHFIPAWQVVEVLWHLNEKSEPETYLFPMWRIRGMR